VLNVGRAVLLLGDDVMAMMQLTESQDIIWEECQVSSKKIRFLSTTLYGDNV
jgi:hypothetical protein